MARNKYYWMAVTADDYELPMCVEESSSALARKLGVSPRTIRVNEFRHKNGKRNGYRIVKVTKEDE